VRRSRSGATVTLIASEDAILDRLMDSAQILETGTESFRFWRTQAAQGGPPFGCVISFGCIAFLMNSRRLAL